MSSSDYKAPKGTRDLSGAEAEAFARLEDIARRTFKLFGYREVRTPLFESVELFSRSLGATSDIVEKEMFTFSDRGERTYALRPEGTAGIVRHYIENSLWTQSGLQRLYYMGPMFRGERPQAGRYRQFFQIGAEYFGSGEPSVDADLVLLAAKILSSFGLSDFTIQVNSLGCRACRPKHREALLAYLKTKEKSLSEESRRRMTVNPLRVLDSKEDGPKLKDAPAMKDFLCADCAAHYRDFLSLVNGSGYAIEENPRLVRGLDYYSRTVFEVISAGLGAQNAVAAGGRYDDLVEMLGGPGTPAVGFALGEDRVVAASAKATVAAATKAAVGPVPSAGKRAYVIPMMEEASVPAFRLAHALRDAGIAVPPVLSKKKLKNQLSLAVDEGANWAILIGEDEMQKRDVTLKDLNTREQVRVSQDQVVERLRSKANGSAC